MSLFDASDKSGNDCFHFTCTSINNKLSIERHYFLFWSITYFKTDMLHFCFQKIWSKAFSLRPVLDTSLLLSISFQNFMTQSKAMELDLENEIEKTKKEGILLNCCTVLLINVVIKSSTVDKLGEWCLKRKVGAVAKTNTEWFDIWSWAVHHAKTPVHDLLLPHTNAAQEGTSGQHCFLIN